MKTEQLLSINDAADYLNLSVHTLRNWIYQRKIGFIKLGGKILFRKDDLDRHITSCFIEPTHK